MHRLTIHLQISRNSILSCTSARRYLSTAWYRPSARRRFRNLPSCSNVSSSISVHPILAYNLTKSLVTRKAHDAEIEMSSQVLSLKCPLSYMRLDTPCRATTCTHVQCFDACSYLQLQQQGPQWLCPVCSKPAPFDRLAVDE